MLLRDASRTPTLVGLDARFFVIIFPTLFVINIWTMIFDVLVLALFITLKIKGLEISFAYRKVRSSIRGLRVNSRPWWFLKKWRNR
jgi:hypothetical protein